MHYASDGGTAGVQHQLQHGKVSNGGGGGPSGISMVVMGEDYADSGSSSSGSSSNNPGHNCSMNAMVICQQCGAFCHDECSSSQLCRSCVMIR